MNFEYFTNEVKLRLKQRLGEEKRVEIKECIKNNGLRLVGLIISSEKEKISPSIYLNEYYIEYDKGECTLEESIDKIYDLYKNSIKKPDFNLEMFTDYNRAKDYIVYKLINYAKNIDLLEDIPYIQYLDLAICFYFRFNSQNFNDASILINNYHLNRWNVSLEDIYEVAKRNTPSLLPVNINDIYDAMIQKADDGGRDFIEEQKDSIVGQMYVLTNDQLLYGATGMLYPEVLRDFSKKINNNFYIIPSSIHELILIPDNEQIDKDMLLEMVKGINSTEVPFEDVLADNVYYYNMEKDKVTNLY